MLKETYYNKYKGWGVKPLESSHVEFVMRSMNHILSPSYDLLNDWKDKKITWEEYTFRFRKEMLFNPICVMYMKYLNNMSKQKDVYLVCSCYNKKNQCHRFLLIDLINNIYLSPM